MLQRASLFAVVSLFAFTTLACSNQSDDTTDEGASRLSDAEYVDALYYFSDQTESDGWYELTDKLQVEFDQICGDTFCEGEYSNIDPLSFRCSVQKSSGNVGKCVWVFAGSNEDVHNKGSLNVDAKTWKCEIPIPAGTPIRDFVKAVSSSDRALYVKLAGGKSIMDGLGDCL